MDISARAISLADRPPTGPFGSPVFARAGKTDPPSRLILSQTSVGKTLFAASSIGRHSSLSFVRASPPFPSSRPAHAGAPRAEGPSKAGRRAGLASRSLAARPRLDGPEHGAMIKLVGTPSHLP